MLILDRNAALPGGPAPHAGRPALPWEFQGRTVHSPGNAIAGRIKRNQGIRDGKNIGVPGLDAGDGVSGRITNAFRLGRAQPPQFAGDRRLLDPVPDDDDRNFLSQPRVLVNA